MSDEPKAETKRTYRRRSDSELEQLSQDIVAGRVFTSAQVDTHDIPMVFMLLSFLDKDDLEWMKSLGITLFYEYMDKALPRSVNGNPCFMSMQYLDHEDHRRLDARYREITAFLDARKVAEPAK